MNKGVHTHCKTCRKGKYGCRQCRLAKRSGHPVAETRCVECVLPAGRGAVVEGAFDWRCPICHRFDGESVAKADQKRDIHFQVRLPRRDPDADPQKRLVVYELRRRQVAAQLRGRPVSDFSAEDLARGAGRGAAAPLLPGQRPAEPSDDAPPVDVPWTDASGAACSRPLTARERRAILDHYHGSLRTTYHASVPSRLAEGDFWRQYFSVKQAVLSGAANHELFKPEHYAPRPPPLDALVHLLEMGPDRVSAELDHAGHVRSVRDVLSSPLARWFIDGAGFVKREELDERLGRLERSAPLAAAAAASLASLNCQQGAVVDHFPGLGACSGSNQAAYPLGAGGAARTAGFYQSKYETKQSVAVREVIPQMVDVRKHVDQWQSKAADSGTAERTAKHFAQRLLITAGVEELSPIVAVSLVLGHDSGSTSEGDVYLYAWDALKQRRGGGAAGGPDDANLPPEDDDADAEAREGRGDLMAAAMQHEDQELVEQALAEGGMEGLALLLGGDKAPLASGGDFDFVDTEAGSTTGYAPVYKLEDGSRVAIAQSVTYDLRDPRLAAFNLLE